ncbi:MAG: hypothetical protein MK171_08960 [Pirellulales bacterium]|nr:hypothetical protein [Pirellulales bacterium]
MQNYRCLLFSAEKISSRLDLLNKELGRRVATDIVSGIHGGQHHIRLLRRVA